MKKINVKIKKITIVENENVYDLTMENNHNFFANNLLVHNCFEIAKLPVNVKINFPAITYEQIPQFVKDNENLFGVQGCNLCEINAEKCRNKKEFFRACYDAAIIGTLQAGYTSFPYLGKVTEEIFKREALLGVSITGWMNNTFLLNPELLKAGAEIVKKTNKEVAIIIDINAAARTTTVKPSGNACTTFDTKIKTNKGVMTLNEVFNYCLENELNPDSLLPNTYAIPKKELHVYDENNELQPITSLYVNGFTEVFEIEFEDGNIFKFTDNHKLKTLSGWKYVKDLTVDDEIISY